MNLQRILGRRLFTALGNWIIRRALRTPYTHLRQADGTPYMDRYWFLQIGKRADKDYPWIGARVHHIQSSDDDRAFHDHPWPFITIILRGGYTELRPKPRGVKVTDRAIRTCIGGLWQWVVATDYTAGQVLRRKATDYHALKLDQHAEAVTLFIVFPAVQKWGFLWRGEKVYYRDFNEMHAGNGVYVTEAPGGQLLPEVARG